MYSYPQVKCLKHLIKHKQLLSTTVITTYICEREQIQKTPISSSLDERRSHKIEAGI